MNQNKKNDGWILCPSKTFPGKFYYFNVLNGEAAWSLTEAENKALRKDTTLHKITDKSHTFPEPASPPIDTNPNRSISNMANVIKQPEFVIPSNNVFSKIPRSQTAMFGQAVFPKYVSNMESYGPNIVWIPTQVPSIHPSIYMPNGPDVKRKLNRCTQTERELFVHTCNVPLSQRFTKYKQEIKHKPCFEYYTAPSRSNVLPKQIIARPDTPKITSTTIIREPILKRVRTQSENDIEHYDNYKANSGEGVLSYDKTACKQSTLFHGSRVDNTMSKQTDDEILENLERNDLRYLLVAKRRKSVDLGILQASEGKKIKTEIQSTPSETIKKHVTFNLDNQEYDSLGEVDSNELHSEEPININNNWKLDNDLCYIIVDAYTLIDDYDLIEQYILSDDKRRLLLPSFVRALIEACCARECRNRTGVIAARHAARRLVNHTRVVTLPEDNRLGPTVMECCTTIMKQRYQVVLITSNIELRVEAASNKITCLTPRQIKDGAKNVNAKPTFDIKIHVQNGTNVNNLFLQPTTEIKPYIFDKRDFPVNSFKTCLFETRDDIKKTINSQVDKIINVNTSPIKDNLRRTFANISKINEENILNYGSTSTATTDIRIDLQNLFIKENKKTASPKTVAQNEPVYKKQICNAEKAKRNNVLIESNFEKRTQNFEIQKQQEKIAEAKSLSQKSSETQKGFNEIEQEYSTKDCLKKYSIKSKVVEERINERLEEFICTFTQVLEDALTYLILRNTPIADRLSPPWVLYELIEMVRKLYGSNAKVKMVGAKLTSLLIKESNKIGKLKVTMKPNDFMNIFGCGCLFIQVLKIIQPSYEELSSAEDALEELLKQIESSTEDCEEPTFQTPIFNRPDVEMIADARQNFVKKPSEIVDYLKRHFVEWETYKQTGEQSYEECEQHQEPQNVDVKIFRTYGRNLSLLKLDKTKAMTLKNPTDATTNVSHGNTDHEIVPDTDTTIDIVHNCSNQTKTDIERKSIDAEENKNIEKFKKKFGIETLPKPTFDGCFSTSYGKQITSKIIDLKNTPKTTKVVDLMDPSNIINNEPKIIRRFGHLLQNLDAFNAFKDNENYFKVNNNYENVSFKSLEENIPLVNTVDLNIPQHSNTFNDETAGPKVIRNINPIESFEGKIKENARMDFAEIDETLSADTVVISNNEIKNDDMSIDESASFVYEIKNKTFKMSDSKTFETSSENLLKDYKISETLIIYDDSNLNNDSTNDSGFENESLHAHSLVKTFLAELSGSFKDIYQFIDESIIEVRNDLPENKKRILHNKASQTRVLVAEIIRKLKRIIHRELNGGTTLEAMLMKAGVDASADKRMTRYRQVVTKCLEQAQMLESALKLMLSITDGQTDYYSDSMNTSIRYFNIFE